MYVVYILKNLNNKIYIGYTTNLDRRIWYHNNGLSIYTNKYKPWKIETYINFNNEKLAKNFERYLKSGSGKAFLRKRLINI
ncbi:MAG: GIY-YIG nuclease family protein [Candidatus Komeilibacteria bacterium]|nr:GIY-YIG nuclease family protein [Candidatus Komeilibacteria bacterium]